ncbi:MAG: flagellar basal body protein [Armatimonadetes bacterium]|nr:flagellar basal body protein [Armatimonadota bacterium]MDW8027480.1 flagellar basal body protein [Armatimonadota bacterium]
MALIGLERALNILSQRTKVLVNNLANANTPAYIRREVSFFALMRAVLSGREEFTTSVQIDWSSPFRADGNNTSPERELAALTETALLYHSILQLAAKEFAQLSSAITEGRR